MVTRTRLDATFICTLPVLFKENYTHDRRVFTFIPTIIIEFALKKFPYVTRHYFGKDKGLPQQAEVAQGVPGRLRPRIFLKFGTTRVVGRQPYEPAAFTPGEIPGTHF
jgi:hypothetical protein